MLHHDNASSHSAKLTAEFLEQKRMEVIEHPPHSLDSAMCDFWLFFNLKKNLHGHCFHSEAETDEAINAVFSSIPRNECLEAFNFWKIHLQKCIHSGGGYFEHSSNFLTLKTSAYFKNLRVTL
ncbi:Histone-lysine N-methyltransferase SETMAR, partial [Stegodyphus mimosarum]